MEQQIAQDEQRSKAALEEESARIVASAEQEIGVAAAQAKRSLRHFAADLAIEQAAKKLVLTPETDRALIAEFVSADGSRRHERRREELMAAAFAARYARAFADVVSSAKLDTAALDRQFNDFLATWDGSAELRELFVNPAVPAAQKVAILDKLNAKMGLQTRTAQPAGGADQQRPHRAMCMKWRRRGARRCRSGWAFARRRL